MTTNKKERRTTYGGMFFMMVGAAAIFGLFYFFVWENSGATQSQFQQGAQPVGPTEFCTNTHLSIQDGNNKEILGEGWLSVNSQIFEQKDMPNKTQKGLTYIYWLENSFYYVRPITFTPHCNDEQDTAPDYITGEAFSIKEPSQVEIFDLNGLTKGNISIKCDSRGCNGGFIIDYLSPVDGAFMPFGGVLIIEYPNRIYDMSCASINDDYSPNPEISPSNRYHVIYTPHEVSQTYKILELTNFDRANGDLHKFVCRFSLSHSASIQVNGTIYVDFIPANFYVTKEKTLVLDVEKYSDGETTRVVNKEVGASINYA